MGRRFLRPDPVVLDDSAVVPPENLVSPPPREFTHVLNAPTDYFYARGRKQGAPDGRLDAGTRVLVVARDDAGRCRVVDRRGLSVYLACSALRAV